jgi:hypothetical protein
MHDIIIRLILGTLLYYKALGVVVRNFQICSPHTILLIAIANVLTPACLGIFAIKIPRMNCLNDALIITIVSGTPRRPLPARL